MKNLSQIFVLIAFFYVFKFSYEILGNIKLSLISLFLLESIYFYNFTTPEFNVNVCQLPFWSLVVFYSWKIYDTKKIEFIDCFLVGLFAALGFLSKYLLIIEFSNYILNTDDSDYLISLASWRSGTCSSSGPQGLLTLLPLWTAGLSSISLAQRITFS